MHTKVLNRQSKDTLFTLIFGENPENALSLYNAINKTEYTNVEDLEITTLKDAIYIGIKNDVSFLFNSDMNLYEHQSTYCPNMPLRGLGYFANLYEIYLGGEELSRFRMYDRTLLKVPAPRYYVFYNGESEQPEITELRLSDAYDGDGDIEIIAHMINVNKGYSDELMSHCKPLSDYSEFFFRLRQYKRDGFTKEEATEMAIDSCIKDGILESLLRKERAKVTSSLITALTEEEIEQLHKYQMERAINEGLEQGIKQGIEQGIKQGIEQGIKQGIKQGSFSAIDKLVSSDTLTEEQACAAIGVDINEYREYRMYLVETADED